MEFKEILELLIVEQSDGSQTKFSQESGIPIPTINGWLTKGRLPRYEQLVQLCRYFNVSADYLLGIVDDVVAPGNSGYLPDSFSIEDYKLLKDLSSLTVTQKNLIKKTIRVFKESE